MYIKLQLVNLAENRRLILLVALLFVLVVSVQYFELPYGNAFFSLFYAGKDQVASAGTFLAANPSDSISSVKPSGDRNSTFYDGLNSTVHTNRIANAAKVSDGNDAISNHFVDSSTGPEGELTSKPDVRGINNPVLGKASDESQIKPSSNENATKVSNVNDAINIGGENENADHPLTVQSSDSLPPFRVPVTMGTNSRATVVSVGHNASSLTGQSSDSLPLFRAPLNMATNSRAPVVSAGHDASFTYKDEDKTLRETGSPGLLKTNPSPLLNYSFVNRNHNANKKSNSDDVVVSLSQLNDMFISSLTSYRAKKPKWVSKSDENLLQAKSLIWSSQAVRYDPSLHAPLFRNYSMFKRSYDLMEQTLKVYIYKEGERPIYHTPVITGIYASEGWFMKLLEGSKKFVTKNPENAHLFYLPYSSWILRKRLYLPDLHSRKKMFQNLNNYLGLIASGYTFWNRTGGADHFLVACHDWAPAETKIIMANCIRALCNADIIKQDFQFGKDVSLPTTNVLSPQNSLNLGGRPPSKRKILAFFAGKMHGHVRAILLKHWQDKDPDMKIFGKMKNIKGQMSYVDHMKNSKYCICAKGYEVNSPRVVEAISYACVPVIVSDNFVPPFFETLNWESFAVFVAEKDIPNLKAILVSIPNKKYLELQRNVKLVQQHFIWHSKPVKYDIFHMILHSIWYTRVFQLGSS